MTITSELNLKPVASQAGSAFWVKADGTVRLLFYNALKQVWAFYTPYAKDGSSDSFSDRESCEMILRNRGFRPLQSGESVTFTAK